jgi:hypothetical protein
VPVEGERRVLDDLVPVEAVAAMSSTTWCRSRVSAVSSTGWSPSGRWAPRSRPAAAGRGGERDVLDDLVPVGGARRVLDDLVPVGGARRVLDDLTPVGAVSAAISTSCRRSRR